MDAIRILRLQKSDRFVLANGAGFDAFIVNVPIRHGDPPAISVPANCMFFTAATPWACRSIFDVG
jgi:hypothetical protein